MEVKIRQLNKNDFKQVEQFLPEMWFMHSNNSNLVDESNLKEMSVSEYLDDILKDNNQEGFVAVAQNIIVGFIRCEKQKCPDFYKEEYEVYIDDLIVLEQYRNKGIATKLIGNCIVFARNNGIKLITSKIWKFNQESEKLFEKYGFKRDYSFYSYKL